MADLVSRFREFITTEKLFHHNQRLLVAVSGGLDSVVLSHLLHKEGHDIVLAHCNFQLRGEESLRDERFVLDWGAALGCGAEVKRFDTAAYAAENKLSVQEAARELRYGWFRELALQVSAPYILTAHHADDNVETMLMNLVKGTGITGLRGILPAHDRLVRPLLFASRADLEAYATENKLQFAEDSSNATDKYSRNYLRHHLLPLLEQIIPGAAENLRQNMPRFRGAESLYREAVTRRLSKLMVPKGAEWHIPVNKLKLADPLTSIVYEMFSRFGFGSGQLGEIIKLMDADTGRFMDSSSHRLLKNRNWFIVSPLQETVPSVYVIDEGKRDILYEGGRLVITSFEKPSDFVPITEAAVAFLDTSLVNYPLVLRRWKEGDYFYPLGMPKKKKIARFLIDKKLNRLEKEHVYVLESGGRILWVVGHRIDDRAKIKSSTRRMLRIEQKTD